MLFQPLSWERSVSEKFGVLELFKLGAIQKEIKSLKYFIDHHDWKKDKWAKIRHKAKADQGNDLIKQQSDLILYLNNNRDKLDPVVRKYLPKEEGK